MSDINTPFAMLPQEQPGDEAAREERHQLLATLLGAFADGELPAETVSQIDAHLLGCARCRREVQVHRVLRMRLEQEPITAAPQSLRYRIAAAIESAPAPSATVTAGDTGAPRRGYRPLFIAVVAVALVLAVAAGGRAILQARLQASVRVVNVSAQPLVRAVLDDSRRVSAGDLPGRARDVASVRLAMPFPVQALDNAELRLLAAWTTTIDAEPAAVLAYRWDDHVVLQYFVSDRQLYRLSEMRTAFASGRALATIDGDLHVVAWPERTAGTLVVSDLSLQRLASLRAGDRLR
jgi:anti-sigma factor RsiW